ncbi:uncharacterized protein LOC123196486 isoform X2 [Mangifera indica]|uniref:uncharacterized protein LOC123196486 isoform X2 n=1 Tax=Mangifera indica TaxID=29780 RepID=UPI001CFB760B|nr:uncharacterized protein LOC123196486 isoform X2 [Mangifera indica]XP_044466482.1 uncharacterized protein LOC123196486 isoform X2 [Mangifera indica]
MAYAAKLLNPIRQSLAAIATSTRPVSRIYGKFESLNTRRKNLEPLLHNNISSFQHLLNIRSKTVQKFCVSGCKTIGCMLGVSVAFGSICFRPHVTYAMDDILLDDYRVDMSDGSNTQEDPFAFWTSLRKFWFPASFILTVLINWEHPFLLGIKIILLLISTKPSTLSVYLYVEQFSHQLMRQKPHLFLFKTIYANKVEVQDYKLLCLARVQVIDQKMTLVGILGGWWAVPSSQGVLSELRTSLRNKKSHDMSFEFTKF